MSLPLCVDLDGTLVFTDTIYEAILQAIKRRPSIVWHFPVWLLRGKAYFKDQVSRGIHLNAVLLPYNQEFLSYLKEERRSGRTLVLASGTHHTIAEAIAKHIGIFSRVVGSDATHNTAGAGKAAALRVLFGSKQFIYAGNSSADLPVWREAASGIVVNASAKVLHQARATTTITKVFPDKPITFDVLRRTMRIHQWVKNILIFIPLITAHKLFLGSNLLNALAAFVAFSCAASSIYIFNDLVDIEADRQHDRKKYRPFAAGALPIPTGLWLGMMLIVISIGVSWWLPPSFLAVLGLYAIINLAYSLYVKQMVVIDVVVLASVYTLRIFAGSAATGVAISTWLWVFSAFLFLSLALLKRYAELSNLHQAGKVVALGRGYASTQRNIVFGFGIGSGYLSLLVLALYIHSDAVRLLYHYPSRLWFILPLLFAWISRIWWLVRQGKVHEDPIVFAVTDSVSYGVGIIAAIILMVAI